jgi:hypothetical protein
MLEQALLRAQDHFWKLRWSLSTNPYDAFAVWEDHIKRTHPEAEDLDILELINLYEGVLEREGLDRWFYCCLGRVSFRAHLLKQKVKNLLGATNA